MVRRIGLYLATVLIFALMLMTVLTALIRPARADMLCMTHQIDFPVKQITPEHETTT